MNLPATLENRDSRDLGEFSRWPERADHELSATMVLSCEKEILNGPAGLKKGF